MYEYFDDSLFRAGASLLEILLKVVRISLLGSLFTLPMFFFVLFLIRFWFWAVDEWGSPVVAGESRQVGKRFLAVILSFGVPIASVATSAFLLAYFGLLDFVAPAEKREFNVGTQVKKVYNTATRKMALDMLDEETREKVVSGNGGPSFGGPPPGAPKKDGPPPKDIEGKIPPDAKGAIGGFKPPTDENAPIGIRLTMVGLRSGLNAQFAAFGFPKTPDMKFTDKLTMVRSSTMIFFLALGPFPTLFVLLSLLFGRKGVVMILRSISRNLLRTSLSYLATFVLSVVVAAVFSILGFIDTVTTERSSNLKTIITEKNQIPSQMPPRTEQDLLRIIEELGKQYPEVRLQNGEDDIMTWGFVAGTLDPQNRSFFNSLFFFCMEPGKVLTMMDGLDELTGEELAMLEEGVNKMTANKQGVIIGKERLKMLGKRVGDDMILTSLNYKDLVFNMTIVGVFPEGGRYDQSAVMNREYLYKSLEEYEGRNGKAHPLADKCLNLVWLRLPTREAFEIVASEVNKPGKFSVAIKMETASSGVNSFLESYKDLIKGLRYLLAPALLAVMCLVISNAISISVRERRTEMAVLKVLGFRPWMVMMLVLGEALLIGALAGFLATATAFAFINAMGGLAFPIAFFPKFLIPATALWWGPAIGAGTALVGSFLPAWSARTVKVSEVFARVA